MRLRLMQLLILLAIVFIQPLSVNGSPKADEVINDIPVYHSIGNYGFVYRNFKFKLTSNNVLLANDSKVVKELGLKRDPDNYRDQIIDEKSDNFITYGQFEVFIPVKFFPLVDHKKGYIIVRMSQTLVDNKYSNDSKDPEKYKYVKEKQALYQKIKKMVLTSEGSVEIILEFPHHNSKEINRNISFRSAHGKYINYIGQLKNK